jgi:hypothetical protein
LRREQAVSDHPCPHRSARSSPDWFSPDRFSLDWFSLDTWAVAAAVAFIVLIVVGVLPRIPW